MSNTRIYNNLYKAIKTPEDYEAVQKIVSVPNFKEAFKNITIEAFPIPAPKKIQAWYKLPGDRVSDRYLYVERNGDQVHFTMYEQVYEEEVSECEYDSEADKYLSSELELNEDFGYLKKINELHSVGHPWIANKEYENMFKEAWALLVNTY